MLDTIPATDYDDGPQGFAVPTGDRGDALRGLKPGQWAKYELDVPSTGYYDITCQVASPAAGRFHLEFNGVNVTGPVEFHPTGGPNAWADVRMPHVRLIAGEQYMKVFAETDSIDIKSIQMSTH